MLQRLKRDFQATNVFASLAAFTSYVLLMVAMPDMAFAADSADDAAGSVSTVVGQMHHIPLLLSLVLYIIGIALIGKGLLTGKKYAENPGSVNGGLFAVLGPIAVGAMLIAAPNVAAWVLSTFAIDGDGVGFADFGGGAAAAEEGEYPGVASLLQKFTIQVWGGGTTALLLSIVFYLVGITLIGKGLLNAKKQSEFGQGSGLSGWMPIIGPLLVGAMLIALPQTINWLWSSIGVDATTTLDLNDPSASDCNAVQNSDGDFESTIGGAICRIYGSVSPDGSGLLSLISAISIIVGILTVGSSLLGAYRLSSGGQGAPKVSGIVWRAIGGALLIALPAGVEMVRHSIFADPNSVANFAFSTFTVADTPSLDRALTAFVDNLKNPMINITFFVFTIIGVAILARTLYAMSGINFEQQKMSPTSMISRLVIGGCLVSSWSIYTTVATTVMGGTPDAIGHTLAYSSEALDTVTATRVNNILNAALVWVQMVGLIAFFRGFLVLKASLDGQGNGGLSPGLTHIIAGTLCINIPWTILMIQNTIPGVRILDS